MKLEKGTKAYKAYHAGLVAKNRSNNPYILAKYSALSNWWVKGFNEAEEKRLEDNNEMPCGCCDMGIYSEMAMLNRAAREFSVLSTAERETGLPKCKKIDRDCVGAKHYSDAIKEIDGK